MAGQQERASAWLMRLANTDPLSRRLRLRFTQHRCRSGIWPIFSVCQFSDEEQRSFLDAYDAAHPKRPKHKQDFRNMRQLSVLVPDLGEAAANRKFDEAVAEFALRMGALFAENGSAHTNGAKPPVKPKRH
jgi:hypothetical protein